MSNDENREKAKGSISIEQSVFENEVLEDNTDASTDNGDEEIALKDFYIKTRRFLEPNNIGIDTINGLYYKEDEKLMPFYECKRQVLSTSCWKVLAVYSLVSCCFLAMKLV